MNTTHSRQVKRYAVRKLWKAILPRVLWNVGPDGKQHPKGNRKQRRAM